MPETAVTLTVPPDIAFTRMLTTAAEAVGQSAGLASRENMRLQLAVEEFFAYLAAVVDAQSPMTVRLEGLRHQVRAVFEVFARDLALGGLNIHSTVRMEQEGEPDRMLGPHLAARMADRFHLDSQGGRFTLVIEVDKAYSTTPEARPAKTLAAPYAASACADPQLLAHAAALARMFYPPWNCPASFAAPAKFADLVADGTASGLVAADATGAPAGLLCWRATGAKALDFAGPFVFGGDRPGVARALTDAFLETVARDGREIVFSLRATADVPPGYFETLGEISALHGDAWTRQPAVYRHLREDMGAMVWAHPSMTPFLSRFYDRLALSREIAAAERAGQTRGQSLLSVAADPGRKLAILKPLLDGADMAENLAKSVAVLQGKGTGDIRAHLDLGVAWQGALGGLLDAAGFRLKIVLPLAERCDLAVYQHACAD